MNTTILEREIKLRFSSADEARDAVIATVHPAARPATAGGRPPRHRRRAACVASDVCSACAWKTERAD